jgi:hypothetical protein
MTYSRLIFEALLASQHQHTHDFSGVKEDLVQIAKYFYFYPFVEITRPFNQCFTVNSRNNAVFNNPEGYFTAESPNLPGRHRTKDS